MTPAVLDRPILLSDRPLPDGRVTLEERLNSVLHSARASGSSECPLCHARVTPTPTGADCAGCGSRLR